MRQEETIEEYLLKRESTIKSKLFISYRGLDFFLLI